MAELATTDDLMTEFRRDSYIAASQPSWTTAKLLAVGDKVIRRRIVPAFVAIDDGYYRETSDVTLVASTSNYDFPRYAMFNKIHQAYLVDSTGKLGILLRKDPVDLKYWNATSTGTPSFLRAEGSQLIANPTPNAGAVTSWPTMRLWIYRRPGRMVPTTSAAQVSSVDSGTGVVTYTGSKPSTFTASSVHDFYAGSSPYRRTGSAVSATASTAADKQTFSTTNAALLSAGDWVCVRDETVIPPVPSLECWPFLCELIQESITKSQGDRKAQEAAIQAIVDDMMTTVAASANRMEAMPKIASLRHSPFVRGAVRRSMNSTRD